jgi:hypothetical protein
MKSFRNIEFIEKNGSHSKIKILGCDTSVPRQAISPGPGPVHSIVFYLGIAFIRARDPECATC